MRIIGNNIILKEVKRLEVKSPSGLIITSQVEPYSRGIVKYVNDHSELSVGDEVYFESYGTPFTIDGEECIIIDESNIVAILS